VQAGAFEFTAERAFLDGSIGRGSRLISRFDLIRRRILKQWNIGRPSGCLCAGGIIKQEGLRDAKPFRPPWQYGKASWRHAHICSGSRAAEWDAILNRTDRWPI
jgi:hypothetical protein